MAGFQSAANAVVSAPGNIGRNKAFVDVLKTQLEGEQAFNAAIGAMSRITKANAEGRPAEEADLDIAMEAMNKVPANRRKDLNDILNSTYELDDRRIEAEGRLRKLQKRLDEYEKRPNVPKAIAMTSSYDLQAKEEIKSGTTQTSR